MAIDLPPVLPPVLADEASYYEIKRGVANSVSIQGAIAGTNIRVYGNKTLDAEAVLAMIADAALPSEFIKQLTRAYHDEGNILTRVVYFRESTTVSVFVSEYLLDSVEGDDKITPYFDGLLGDTNLTLNEFYNARELANIRSERSGVNYRTHFEVLDEKRATLVFEPEPVADHDATDIFVEVNNRGSRFAGRYYGIAGLQHNFTAGTQASLAYQHAFSDLGGSRYGNDLDQLKFTLDHPFTFGLYGVELTHVEYESIAESVQTTQGGCALLILGCTPASSQNIERSADGEISEVALTGKQYLYSTPLLGITLSQRLEHVDTKVEAEGFSDSILDETYQVAELGIDYSRRPAPVRGDSSLQAGLKIRYGLGGDSGTLDRYEEFRAQNPSASVPDVVPAARSADFLTVHPHVDYHWRYAPQWVASASFKGQFANEQLPQQQQYVLGGMYSLSAYLPGALIGDEGYLLRLNVTTRRNWWGF
ncbi:ShlB/FhaC/HecB family hemolysin secretion/activation protein, partial [Litorivivens sp.]